MISINIGLQTRNGPFVAIKAVVDSGSQVSVIPEHLIKELNLKVTPTRKKISIQNSLTDLGEHPLCEVNMMVDTRDNGSAILDGFEVLRVTSKGHMVLGLDMLAKFSYAIADGVAFILNFKTEEVPAATSQ